MLYIILLILIAEQVIYFILGEYVCRYGICIATVSISGKRPISLSNGEKIQLYGLKARYNENRNELYFRKIYPALSWGPHLFVGQVRMEDPTLLKVRIGVFTGIFIVAILIGQALKPVFGLNDLLNTICLVALVVVSFFWFRGSIFKNLSK